MYHSQNTARPSRPASATIILLHGSGQQAASWEKTTARLPQPGHVLCPELASLLGGQEATFHNLYAGLSQYCGAVPGPLHLCGLSLGGILALRYALDHPEKVRTLVLAGTPHKVPKAAFALQNAVFRLLPSSLFRTMAFDKKATFKLGNSMKDLDLSGEVEKITCPTLILCGEKDKSNLPSARFLAQAIPGARLSLLPHAGHVLNEEAPEVLARLLVSFYALHP